MIPGVFSAAAARQGPRLWTPADLAMPPQVWADWDSALTNVDGHASAWSNANGTLGGQFSQGSAARRPQIITLPDGKPALRFAAGGSAIMEASAGVLSLYRNATSGWVFIVCRRASLDGSPVTRPVFYVQQGASTNPRAAVYTGAGSSGNTNKFAGGSGRVDNTAPTVVFGTAMGAGFDLLHVDFNWSAGSITLHRSGSPDGSGSLPSSGATSNTNAGGVSLGGFGSSFVSDAEVVAVLAGSGALNAADRQRLEGWAAWECGLEDRLPAGHPYRDERPMAAPATPVLKSLWIGNQS